MLTLYSHFSSLPGYNGGVLISLTAREREAWEESKNYPKQPSSNM